MANVDWLSFTFTELSVQEVLGLLGRYFEGWNGGKGRFGYRQAWFSGGCTVMYDGSPGMGCHVQISGQGVAQIANSGEFVSWGVLVSDWLGRGGLPTRADCAFDDRTGLVTMAAVREAQEGGRITCKWHDFEPRERWHGAEKTMDCLYFGSLKSDTSLCIYDKRLESIARGEEDPGNWVRFEMRFKRDEALRFVNWLVEHPNLEGSEGFLRSAFQVRVAEGVGRVHNREVEGWWSKFCADCGRIVLPSIRKVKSMYERVPAWLKQQAATFVALMLCYDAVNGRGTFCTKVFEEGWRKLSVERLTEYGAWSCGSDYTAALRAWRKDGKS